MYEKFHDGYKIVTTLSHNLYDHKMITRRYINQAPGKVKNSLPHTHKTRVTNQAALEKHDCR